MTFAVVPQSDTAQIVEAINYLLGNLNTGFNADPATGQVIGPNNQVVGYLYKYMAVKYADSADGSVNFSDSPTNRQYYGTRNSNDSVESTNPADYIWTQVTGGFGTTKRLYYTTTGGRQIEFRVDTSLPAVEWAPVPTSAIDLDVITSGSVLSTTFVPFFQPSTLQVPYATGPNFSGVIAKLYASNSQGYVNFSTAQTDSDPSFVNDSWRIGNSATTGNGDISYSNITVGSPVDGGGFAQWPAPTAMSASPALITVPVRYKNSVGVVTQSTPASIQITFATSGNSTRIAYARIPGSPTPITGTITTSGSSSYPTAGQSASIWGISTVWSGIDPNPSSTDSLYQSDGIYDPVTNTTTWYTPYISSLRVGTLSAITVNTGSLDVTGTLTVGSSGAVRGGQTDFNTGTGFFLGYSGGNYKFSIGNSTVNMLWDGSSMTVNGATIQTGTSGARLVMGGPSYAHGIVGYNSSGGQTMLFNASTGQVTASNYAGGIAGDFDNTGAGPALRGQNTGFSNGGGVYGSSSSGFGGEFYGNTSRGTVYVHPLPSLPSNVINGGLAVYNNNLYFCNGTTWKQVQLI